MSKPYVDWEGVRPEPFVSMLSRAGLLKPNTHWEVSYEEDGQPVYRRYHGRELTVVMRPKRKALEALIP